VLGYIFEKYINQKAFGAYYTRPEITEYLCDRTINKLILDRVNATLPQQDPRKIQQFESIDDLVMHMEVDVCRHLVYGEDSILRNLSLLDPACGSGAFLIAAMKTLIRIYERVIGVVQLSSDHQLRDWLDQVVKDHPSLPYFIKKRIITDNLYGVDIMEEAVEIAKLRLFLALVSSARKADELEPLPNIDFNIMAGNSLIGLIRVDEESFDAVGNSEFQQGNLLQLDAANNYRAILDEKNRSIELYKKHSFLRSDPNGTEQDDRLQILRDHIDEVNHEAEEKLNHLLLNEFTQRLGISFQQVQDKGNPKKRNLNLEDINNLKPFHWGYHFDRIIEKKGGFDAIIANPPWETFQPDGKEFFSPYTELVSKKKMSVQEFNNESERILIDPDIKEIWFRYQSEFIHQREYFRCAHQYRNQVPIVNGKKHGKDVNLYKLFLEQCFNLLHSNGECGIVIPAGICTDLGAKKLREMLLANTRITGLFCFENKKEIFEGVHRSYKFSVLTFEKGATTYEFPAAFMRSDINDIENFPDKESFLITTDFIRKTSPDSLSITEIKNSFDFVLLNKLFIHPLIGQHLEDGWNLVLGRELNMTDDAYLFRTEYTESSLPLYEGKMIHQFTHQFSEPRYWIEEGDGRKASLKKNETDQGQDLNYQKYRVGFRTVGENTNSRNLLAAIIPKNSFSGNSIYLSKKLDYESNRLLFICAVLNSFLLDYLIRQKISRNVNVFYVYQLPMPRLSSGDSYFNDIVDRAAKLICTTPEFDDLAVETGLGSHANGVTDAAHRAQLRAELDGMIAHLYGLTEAEFTHILSTFPIVPDATKQAALEEYRNFAPKVGDAEILDLIAKGESAQLEFKSTARWDLKENKKNPVMEEVILKTVAAFLNSDGGTLLIGVDDDGNILGLQNDYQAFTKKPNRDGYELWLTNDLLLKEMGKEFAPFIHISFHIIDNQEICKVAVERAPEPAYVTIRTKNGQPNSVFSFAQATPPPSWIHPKRSPITPKLAGHNPM
jgi:Alw26I/Eco31I/Esp3I family type II restriction m6 adenine DNA methyltransferase